MPSQRVVAERQYFNIRKIKGVNVSGAPSDIPDDKAIRIINYMPIIGEKLKAIPAYTTVTLGGALSSNVTRILPAYVGAHTGTAKAVVLLFRADGGMSVHDIGAGTLTEIWAAGTFTVTPRCVQWKQERVLVADPTNGLYQYDGATGALIDATIKGTYITTYDGRVYLGKLPQNTIIFSAPDSYTDYTTASGAGSFILNEPNLKGEMTGFASTTNVLYIFGETATFAISNVISIGGVANFNLTPLYATIGCKYPDSIAIFENIVYTMDTNGIWSIVGFDTQRISGDIDDYLPSINFASFKPVGFIGNVYDINFYGLLVDITPPGQSTAERWILVWYNQGWVFFKLGLATAFVSNSFERQGVFYNYASDTTNVRNFFDKNSSVSILRQLATKAYDFGNKALDKFISRLRLDIDDVQNNVTFTGRLLGKVTTSFTLLAAPSGFIQWQNNTPANITFVNNSAQTLTFVIEGIELNKHKEVQGRGIAIQLDLQETSAVLYTINNIMLEYFYRSRWN